MFKLNEKYEIDSGILKCDYIRYSPSEKSRIITGNCQVYFNVPREDSVISLFNTYLELILMYYMLLPITDMQMKII